MEWQGIITVEYGSVSQTGFSKVKIKAPQRKFYCFIRMTI
jgi:hypothetical protein